MKMTRFRNLMLFLIAVGIVAPACAFLAPCCHAAEPGKGTPTVKAGPDRVVILGGKTYLTGEVSASKEKDAPPTPVVWSKASGPGKVTFAVNRDPVINDATMRDARQVGLTDIMPVIDNGSDSLGTMLDVCSPEFRRRFESA